MRHQHSHLGIMFLLQVLDIFDRKTGYIWVQSNEGNWSLVQGWEKEAEPQMCEI
jgi:hypothetical protein